MILHLKQYCSSDIMNISASCQLETHQGQFGSLQTSRLAPLESEYFSKFPIQDQ
uniref:Uncharacterized protein n=1 Tax=Arundo donax TaxID=35708 RepID=A0A0A9DGM9_ARUDO